MADMHILDGDGSTWRIVMHFTVPNVNNSVGVNFRTALVNSNIGRKVNDDGTFGRRTILVSGTGEGEITTAEEALLNNGTLFEHVTDFPVESSSTTVPALRQTVRDFFALENDRIQERIGARLRYFGHTESAS